MKGRRLWICRVQTRIVYSTYRKPLDVLARDRPVIANASAFDEPATPDGDFPFRLAAVGSGTSHREERISLLYILLAGQAVSRSGPHWRFCGALTGAAEERSGRAAQDRRHAKSGSALKFRERPRPHRHRLSKRQKPRHLPPRAGMPNESRKISNR